MSEPKADAKVIFLAALECEGAEAQSRFLDQACGADAALRRRVEELLQANRDAGGFLGGVGKPEATLDEPAAASPGTVIGPYKLIEQIGEGGMGTVWMAQQTEPVKRVVALKLIKAGMDSKQVIARFEGERQALALMEHPNIARVLDGGTTDTGRPYFVMDLVKGVPITKYCDEHRLTPRQRLELFIPVCHAIQHAHQKGIIHRDLKPSNVLVALYDGKPVPKVIDFGVAKAAGQPLTEQTLVTGFGNIIGTLEYMSPEQAEINQLDIDTRSDIYSLGVLLYELLAGSPPFSRKDLEKAGMLEMLRMIREQEPSKPSTKLSTADGLPTLAANRGTEPAKLTKLVRGELDWIVMKALEKDRNRRYETANGFAMDVQRYLADEAVQACPPSVGYRLRKFVRRNGRTIATAAVLAAAIVLAVGVSGWAIRDRAAREQENARQEESRRARLANDFRFALERAELFHQQGTRPEALAALERAAQLAREAELNSQQTGRMVALQERLDAEARDMEFVTAFEKLRLEDLTRVDIGSSRFDGTAIYPRIKELFRPFGITTGVTETAHAADLIRSRPAAVQERLLAALHEGLGLAPKHDVQMRRWLSEVVGAIERNPWRTEVRRACEVGDQAKLALLIEKTDIDGHPPSFLLWVRRRLQPPDGLVALEFLRRIQRAHPGDFWANTDLGMTLLRAKQPAEAIRYFTASLALRPNNPGALVNRATALKGAGELEPAAVDLRQAIKKAPAYATAHYNLGNTLRDMGQSEEAIAAFEEVLRLKPDYWEARNNLALLLRTKGWLPPAPSQELRAHWRREMQLKTEALRIHKLDMNGPVPIERVQGPLFSYFEPSPKACESALWAWGRKGRPAAIVVTSTFPVHEEWGSMVLEFLSLTEARVTAQAPNAQWRWEPKQPALTASAFADAPAPKAHATERLQQMKDLAGQMAASRGEKAGRVSLSLMNEPIHRYADDDVGLVDGAMFLFTNDKDPEIILLVEARREPKGSVKWYYALARMSFGDLAVTLEGHTVWHQKGGREFRPGPHDGYWSVRVPCPPGK
ncbi:MAG: protein kinase [Planctomycetaceae bacterium]|nr:protein kinase [Planctomycetaceae bacterium]